MPSRSERHRREEKNNRRVAKNQELYQEMRRYDNYREIGEIEPVIEKEYDMEMSKEKRKTRTESRVEERSPGILTSIIDNDSVQEHDINKILIEAKKMRERPDELEAKRKLKKEEYNITSQVDMKNIDELKEKRKNSGVKEEEQGELKELIDTIYSKSLKEKIDEKLEDDESDLFSDLLPSREDETLISENLSTDILNQELEKKQQQEKGKNEKLENSFFTKSMELSDKDMEEDEELFLDEKRLPIWAIILIVLTILAVVGLVGYWVYRSVL